MARVSAVIYKQFRRSDGTYNVRIKVFHKNERRLMSTAHYISERNLSSNLEIKDPTINLLINKRLDDYRRTISKLDNVLKTMSCIELAEYLDNKDNINFIKFCDEHIAQLRKDNRIGTANNHRTVRNSLVDYFKRESIDILEINSNMLFKYERYLREDRKMIRVNQLGKEVLVTKTGLSDNGLYNHMRDLRTLFNAARAFYNNEDLGLIQIEHKPFKTYSIGSAPITKNRNISVEQLKIIRDCQLEVGTRVELARDLFMLSFYLCRMNAVDLYNLKTTDLQNGRISYNRSKTVRQRKDKAFISIRLVEEASSLLNKYIGQLSLKYVDYLGLDTALSKGMIELRDITDIPDITFYYARHTFANLARNACRVSKDDLDLTLNHVDQRHRVLDIYLDKDWSIVDEVQKKVVQLLTE
ncbi:MAG: recombinase [Mucilaginibacter sp.]|nr:recombinase [Mucilaginibacter sp.]